VNGSVIDTNVIIKMLNNDQTAILLLEKAGRAFVPVIVVGELFYGAYKSSKREANIALFQMVLAQFEILTVDDETARSYGMIKADLAKIGFSIPENDLWIAATAHAHNLSLATFDAHFKNIAQINIVPTD
jgi:tRNA(fMet)-specific endonuclease VapC